MLPYGKQVIMVSPASYTNGATATGVCDCNGYDFATVDIAMATANTTSNNPSVLKLAHCNTSNGTFTDLTSYVGDGAGGFTVPAAVTAGVWGIKFNVDLRGKKRWLKVSISPTTTQITSVVANLFRAEDLPLDTTYANVKAIVNS